MTLYKLTKKMNGKVIVDSIDHLPVINKRKKQLTSSYRGQKVELNIELANEEDDKYRKPLTDQSWRGGSSYAQRRKNRLKINSAKRKNHK